MKVLTTAACLIAPRASLFALAIGVGGLLATASGAALAAPIMYTFDNAMTTLNGTSLTISGSFTYDPDTQTEDSIAMTMAGGAPFDGSYNDLLNDDVLNTGFEVCASEGSAQPSLCIDFLNDLGDAPDPLTATTWNSDSGAEAEYNDVSPSGTADPAVPEPASLVLLGSAIGLVRLMRRGGRRA